MNNQKQINAYSIVALVLGVLAVVGAFMPIITYGAWIVGVLGMVFGGLGMKHYKDL